MAGGLAVFGGVATLRSWDDCGLAVVGGLITFLCGGSANAAGTVNAKIDINNISFFIFFSLCELDISNILNVIHKKKGRKNAPFLQ